MSHLSNRSSEKQKLEGGANRGRFGGRVAKESDPLLSGGRAFGRGVTSGYIRSRRSSKSPVQQTNSQYFVQDHRPMIGNRPDDNDDDGFDAEHDGYESIEDSSIQSRQQLLTNAVAPVVAAGDIEDDLSAQQSQRSVAKSQSTSSGGNSPVRENLPSVAGGDGSHTGNTKNSNNSQISPALDTRSVGSGSEQPPLLEIPEEIYAVRKAALQVLKPLNKTWVSRRFTMIVYPFSLTISDVLTQ